MRKEIKKQARARLKRVYGMIMVLCLLLAVLGIEYSNSLSALELGTEGKTGISISSNESMTSQVLKQLVKGNVTRGTAMAESNAQAKQNSVTEYGALALGHSKGVLAGLTNSVTSGELVADLYSTVKNMTNASGTVMAVLILLAFIFLYSVKILVFNVFHVSVKRAALELRLYDHYPVKRLLYLVSVRRVWNVVLGQVLTHFYQFLWMFTIVGGLIKGYSYKLVPFILAENPSITPQRAIMLSRRMMDGHKWEAFVMSLSFLGWDFLSGVTMGLVGVLYSNPYKELTWAEYYARLRAEAKEKQIPDSDLLNDTYLFEKADQALLEETYADVQDYLQAAEGPLPVHTGLRGFMEKFFGLNLRCDEDEELYRKKRALQLAIEDFRHTMDGNMYPFRLFIRNNKQNTVKLASVQYDRHYAITSLVFLFIAMGLVGWLWEGSLHLIKDGVLINRGVLHGPWVPIYGFGSVLILVFLNKLRRHPLYEFLAAIVLCGCVEYFSSWMLEITQDGTKWWDYTGYFLNINGRVCAEGLLIFGLGGIAIVYLVAPLLDNYFRKIPQKVAAVLAVLLVLAFTGDAIYSHYHPNTGEGITDYGEEASSSAEEETLPATAAVPGVTEFLMEAA